MKVVRGLVELLPGALIGTTSTADEGLFASSRAGRASTGATPREEAALRRVRTVGTLLDDAVRVPGTNFRVGLDPIVGVLPVAGDTVTTILALYPILEAYRLGAPRSMLLRMLALVGVDAVVGSIPLLGTVFDAFWKANRWNVRSLERYLQED